MEQASRAKTLRILMILCRVALGIIFIFAAFSKMKPLEGMPWTVGSVKTSLAMFAMGIDSYQILPAWAVTPMAQTLPFIEIGLGLWLISGIWLRLSSLVSILMLCMFIVAMYSVWRRGLTVTCGCFGQGGSPITTKEMMRDGFLFMPLALVPFIGSFFLNRKSRPAVAAGAMSVSQSPQV